MFTASKTSLCFSTYLVILLCVVSLSAAATVLRCHERFSREDYPFCAKLSPTYVVHWSLTKGDVNFAIEAAQSGEGYVAFGVSEQGGMIGADLWVLANAVMGPPEWILYDMNAWSYAPPRIDDQPNLVLKTVYADSKTTAFEMTRKLHVCDTYNDVRLYPNETMSFVWAHNTNSWGYHGLLNRGTVRMKLWPDAQKPAGKEAAGQTAATQGLSIAGDEADDIVQTDIQGQTGNNRQTDIQGLNDTKRSQLARTAALQATAPVPGDAIEPNLIESNLTLALPALAGAEAVPFYVACSNFESPRDAKYHITSVHYTGTHPNVRRIMLWACEGPAAQPGKAYACPLSPQPPCDVLYSSWLPGQGDDVLPSEVGLPLGKGSVQSLAIQVQHRTAGNIPDGDSMPGVTLTLTKALRKYDMGVLVLGQRHLDIPVANESFKAEPSICPSLCTKLLLDDDVKLTEQAGHMGEFGKRVGTKHVRKKVEIPAVGNRYGWDPVFQGYSFVTPGSRILSPGDTLITTCTYNTLAARTNSTITHELETCRHFVRYFPAKPLSICWGIPPHLYQPNLAPAAAICTSHSKYTSLLYSKQWDSDWEFLREAHKNGMMVGFNPQKTMASFDKLQLWKGCSTPGPAPPTMVFEVPAVPSPAPPSIPPASARPQPTASKSPVVGSRGGPTGVGREQAADSSQTDLQQPVAGVGERVGAGARAGSGAAAPSRNGSMAARPSNGAGLGPLGAVTVLSWLPWLLTGWGWMAAGGLACLQAACL